MSKLKITAVAAVTILALTSCSFVDKLKERFSKKEDAEHKEQTVTSDGKEHTVENTTSGDLEFYNKYMEVLNKVSDVVGGLNETYLDNIPAPKSVRKGIILVTVSFDLKVGDAERLSKELRRSYYDGGDLSKLTANPDMKKDVESNFKLLLDELGNYYNIAKKVSDYYHDRVYEQDPSKAEGYDKQMKDEYKKIEDEYDKFHDVLKKYRPMRNQRDPESITDPDQKSMAVLMNSYENTLDKAEDFYDEFKKIDRSSDLSGIERNIDEFEKSFETEKNKVESTAFTDRTKSMKYSFEDYFSKTVSDFVKTVRKFTEGAPKMKESEYNRANNEVVQYYNYMINSYNSSINSLNTMQKYY